MTNTYIIGGALPTLYKNDYLISKPWYTPQDKKMSGIEYLKKYVSKFHIDEPYHNSLNNTIKKMGDKILLIKAGTGSGKTTSIAPELYINLKYKKNFLVAVPTILIAKEKTYDILEIENFSKHLKLGKNLGFVTGDSKSNIRIKERGIIISTQGTLKAKLLNDNEKFMRRYDFILLDEFHLRTIDTDFTLSLIKKFLENNWKNPNCPLFILMSATFREKIYMNYLNIPKENFIEVKGALNYPVKEIFPSIDIDDYKEYIKTLILNIHLENLEDIKTDVKDIIVFLPTSGTIRKLLEYVDLINSKILNKPIKDILKAQNKNLNQKINLNTKYFLSPIELTGSTYKNIGKNYKKFISNIKNIKQKVYHFENNKINKKKI